MMSTNPVQLRQANENDAPILLAVLHAAFEEYRGRLDPPSGVHAETIESVQSKLKTETGVLAFVGNEPAGCVFYEKENEHIYLGRLSVLPRFRKVGVGRALIDYVEAQAANLKVHRVQLGVRIALPQLKAYYEKLGYHIVSYETHPGYIQPTYVMMEKDVKQGPLNNGK
jgi:ribosomal protein S18 acetylase RimI-like enzyme